MKLVFKLMLFSWKLLILRWNKNQNIPNDELRYEYKFFCMNKCNKQKCPSSLTRINKVFLLFYVWVWFFFNFINWLDTRRNVLDWIDVLCKKSRSLEIPCIFYVGFTHQPLTPSNVDMCLFFLFLALLGQNRNVQFFWPYKMWSKRKLFCRVWNINWILLQFRCLMHWTRRVQFCKLNVHIFKMHCFEWHSRTKSLLSTSDLTICAT